MEAIGRESMQNRGMLRWSEMAKADNLDSPAKVTFGTSIRVQIQLQIVADNSVISEHEILYFDKDDDRLEAIGLLLDAAKVVLRRRAQISASAIGLGAWCDGVVPFRVKGIALNVKGGHLRGGDFDAFLIDVGIQFARDGQAS
jgi:hypothetical protein